MCENPPRSPLSLSLSLSLSLTCATITPLALLPPILLPQQLCHRALPLLLPPWHSCPLYYYPAAVPPRASATITPWHSCPLYYYPSSGATARFRYYYPLALLPPILKLRQRCQPRTLQRRKNALLRARWSMWPAKRGRRRTRAPVQQRVWQDSQNSRFAATCQTVEGECMRMYSV